MCSRSSRAARGRSRSWRLNLGGTPGTAVSHGCGAWPTATSAGWPRASRRGAGHHHTLTTTSRPAASSRARAPRPCRASSGSLRSARRCATSTTDASCRRRRPACRPRGPARRNAPRRSRASGSEAVLLR
jgi:hypothetical protein